MIQALHLKREHVILVLSAGEYQLLQVESPNVPESERKQAVVWKLKDVLGYPVDQATVDAIAIPQDAGYPGRGGLMYAVAARNEIIQRYMESFESAGALLDVIDIPELAQRNMAALLEEAGRGIALLSFNEDGGLLTFTAGGELYHARSIEISTHQLSGMDAEQRRYVFERLVLELQRSLDNFERQFSYVTISKLVLAPMPGQAVLEEYLRENLGVTVISLDLAEVMNIAAIEELQAPAAQSQCFLALGAALRPAEATT
ncbi:MAG: agglutinin biogenesis protein MshI [Methylophilaceae bacterium]|nr:agglutinin biogenesis protein MshI [Methylophilaceae bacterium]